MSGTTDGAVGSAAASGDDSTHPEHRSRWPIVAAGGAAALYVGVGLILVGLELVPDLLAGGLVAVGVGGLLGGLAGWADEAFLADYPHGEADAGRRRTVYRSGMVAFLVSDVATFLAGFVYYAFVRVGPWPPADLPPVVSSLVLVNTGLLVASSVTLHLGHGALAAGDRGRFRTLLAVTVALGVAFLGGQALEYYEFVVGEGFGLADGVFASAFYGLTGLHGLHVALGVVLLGVLLWRTRRGHFAAGRETAVGTVSLYWHFVDAVWLVLVAVLYVGSSVGA